MTYPKSCLKRGSVSSTSSDADSIASTSPRQFPCIPRFSLAESTCSSIPSASTSSSSLPPDTGASEGTRRKSVTFCEDDDIRVFYPPPTPLHKQAKRAASRLLRACADAMRIEPYEFPDEEGYMREEWAFYSPEASPYARREYAYSPDSPRMQRSYASSSPDSPCFLTTFANVRIDDMHVASHR